MDSGQTPLCSRNTSPTTDSGQDKTPLCSRNASPTMDSWQHSTIQPSPYYPYPDCVSTVRVYIPKATYHPPVQSLVVTAHCPIVAYERLLSFMISPQELGASSTYHPSVCVPKTKYPFAFPYRHQEISRGISKDLDTIKYINTLRSRLHSAFKPPKQ